MSTHFPSIHLRGGQFGRSGVVLATVVLVALAATVDLPRLPETVPILAPLGLAVRDDADDAAQRLTEAVDSLADGEYDLDLPTDRDDELGRLSERVEALAADLRERERRDERRRSFTADLLDAVDDVFYVLDSDGNVRRWNEQLETVTGYDEDEIAGMHALDFFVEADREAVAAAIRRVFDGGEARVDARYRTKAGDAIPYEFVAASLEDPNGDRILTGIGRDVSERIRYERDLERTTHLMEQSQRLAGVGAWEVDVSGDEPDLWLSDEVARLHGLEPGEDVDLETVVDVYHPDDRATLREAVERAIETGEGWDLELRVEPTDGGWRWARTIGEPVVDEDEGTAAGGPTPPSDGEVVAVRGSMQDVTDRKRRERDLERTSERLDTVVSNVPVVLFAYDADGRITLSEGRGLSTLDYEPGELVGESVFDLYEDNDAILGDVERTLAGERVREIREVGDVVFETTYQPVFDCDAPAPAGGEPAAGSRAAADDDREVSEVIAVSMDVTERRERERELERYETIVQAVGDPVYALDADGNFRFVNDAVETLAGWDPDALVGEPVTTVMTESDFETGRETIRALRRGDESFRTFEMGLETVDGGVIETENSMALLSPEADEFAGIAGVVRDIGDRVERERELERTRDLLQRVQRMARIGGWELDLRTDPPDITWTEELYRLHGLPRDASLDLETALACYHQDDRPEIRRKLDRAVETGTGYDVEGRLVTDSAGTRWARAMGEPIYRGDSAGPEPNGRAGGDEGDLVAYRGAVQDVTDRKERELALEALHETALELLNADSTTAVAERVVETADEVLDVGGASLYGLDDETNELVPLASTPAFVDHCGTPRPVPVESDSVLWNAFATGVRTAIDDRATIDRSVAFGDPVEQALVVPVGDHGVFTAVATETAVDEASRRLAETLAATAAAAFDRLESEADLRKRDAALAEQNRRLQRQMRVTEIIRSIDRSLIRADSREAIERTVCAELVEADGIAFAWIGSRDGGALEPRAWAGGEESYLDAVSLDLDAAEPAATAVERSNTVVVPNVVDRLTRESWRTEALGRGFQSVVAVPLTYEDYTYGVLSVYADDPDAFADLERSVFAELGDGIANAINAVQTRAALHAETRTEVTLEIEAADELLARLARTSGRRVEYEGLGTLSDDGAVLFVTTSGGDPEAVESALDELVAVEDYRLVSAAEEACRFEVTAAGDTLPARLVRHGGTPRSIVTTGSETEVVADLPQTTDVRAFVEMLRGAYDAVELRGRRDVEREDGTSRTMAATLFDALTPRQLEVLRTAYFAGFFEWPRESTGQEVAEMLSVSQPTVNRHLRLGQGRLLAQLFENVRHVEPVAE